jgi:hypothetical protein
LRNTGDPQPETDLVLIVNDSLTQTFSVKTQWIASMTLEVEGLRCSWSRGLLWIGGGNVHLLAGAMDGVELHSDVVRLIPGKSMRIWL